MVREVTLLSSSPNCSIDHIATKHAANGGLQVEVLPTKDDLTFKHGTSITDDESGFSESGTISARSSPVPLLNEDDYDLASILSDESKKEFFASISFT